VTGILGNWGGNLEEGLSEAVVRTRLMEFNLGCDALKEK
jgi:hypothetical protein